MGLVLTVVSYFPLTLDTSLPDRPICMISMLPDSESL